MNKTIKKVKIVKTKKNNEEVPVSNGLNWDKWTKEKKKEVPPKTLNIQVEDTIELKEEIQ